METTSVSQLNEQTDRQAHSYSLHPHKFPAGEDFKVYVSSEVTAIYRLHATNLLALAFSQSDIRAIISAPYLFGVVTFVLFAVATPNKYGDLLFESRMTSPRHEAQSDSDNWHHRMG